MQVIAVNQQMTFWNQVQPVWGPQSPVPKFKHQKFIYICLLDVTLVWFLRVFKDLLPTY